MRIEQQEGFILHYRYYKEMSLIAEFLLKKQGRVALLIKGAKSKKSRVKGYLQPFSPLLVAASGRGNLKVAQQLESASRPVMLAGNALFTGLYLNELLLKLVQPEEFVEGLYDRYYDLLLVLMKTPFEEKLRLFELFLLKKLGFSPSFTKAIDENAISPRRMYRLREMQGFEETPEKAVSKQQVFPGAFLLALSEERVPVQYLALAKLLNRMLFFPILPDKRLHSRELFMRYNTTV